MTKGKSYFLLLITALILFVSSFFVIGKNNLIINIGDTYFVASLKDAIVLFFILFLFSGVFYWLSEKFKISLNAVLSNIHIFGTLILSFLFFFFNHKRLETFNQKPVFADILNGINYNSYLIFSLIAIIFIQFLFIINIFATLIKK